MDTKKRVLVVDDEPGIGKFLSIKIQHAGFDVTTTTSGAEAIEIIRKQETDIVLLDILMPNVTGIDVIDRVRTFSEVPIVVLTAKPDMVQFAMTLGANDSIGKPFNPDDVVNKIKAVLSSEPKR